MNDVAEALTDVLNNFCKCGVQMNYFGNMRFLCDDNDNNRVLFQASVIGTPTFGSVELIEYLDQWKNSSPIVVVEGLQLQVDSMCDVSIDDFGIHTHCTTPIDLDIARQTGDRSGPYIAGISVVIVAALVFALVMVVVVFLYRRIRIKRRRQLRLIFDC